MTNATTIHLLDESLAAIGYTLERNDIGLGFVLGLVFNATGDRAVGLVKQKGPAFLHGKITFPGGRVEAGDLSLEHRTSDELRQEANILVVPDQWKFVAQCAEMSVFCAALPDISMARTMEVEPVFQFDVQLQLAMAQKRPQMFAPDFIPLTSKARAILGF